MITDIEVERLSTGYYMARPAGQLGTCGWYPFAWGAAYGHTSLHARQLFNEAHRDKLGAIMIQDGPAHHQYLCE